MKFLQYEAVHAGLHQQKWKSTTIQSLDIISKVWHDFLAELWKCGKSVNIGRMQGSCCAMRAVVPVWYTCTSYVFNIYSVITVPLVAATCDGFYLHGRQ